jgi:4-amino-4-deoxy-L-arabinose transferase-like glycosyltransferase
MPPQVPGSAAIAGKARSVRGVLERALTFGARNPQSARRIALLILAGSSLFGLLFFDSVAFGARAFRAANTGYEQIAQSLAQQGSYSAHGHPTAFRPPLYPLFLAAHIAVFGEAWPMMARASQALMSFGCGYLLAVLSERITGSAAARVLAAVFYAGFLPVQIEAAAKRETVLFVLLSLACVALISAERRSVGRMAALGALVGAAFLTRPTGLLLGIVAIATLLAPLRAERPATRVRNAAVVAGCALVVLSPWYVRNYVVWGVATLSTSSTGSWVNVLKGNNPGFWVHFPWIDSDKYDLILFPAHGIHGYMELDQGSGLKSAALEYIVAEPGRALIRSLAKAVVFLSPISVPLGSGDIVSGAGGLEIRGFRFRNPAIMLVYAAYTLAFYWSIVRAFRGLASYGATVRTVYAFVGGFALLLVVLHVIACPETRYRLPLDALLVLVLSLEAHRALSSRPA